MADKTERSISMSVIKRMPRYYRFLAGLKKNGIERISSKELSAKMGFTASQIRQDLNCFGGFGQQGYGYNVNQLYEEIGSILGVDNGFKTIIIGMGNLGKAMASHIRFSNSGFDVVGYFDKSDSVIGLTVHDIQVSSSDSLEDFCKNNKVDVAVLCIPETEANAVVSLLCENGVTNFWNFSHFDISSNYPGTIVENVHLKDSLMTLNYQIANKE